MAVTKNTQDEDDEKHVIRDGGRVTVPLHLMDSLQRAVALHRPGYVGDGGTAGADQRQAAFDAEGARLRDAWRNPTPPAPSQSTEPPLATVDARDAAWRAEGDRVRNAWRGA